MKFIWYITGGRPMHYIHTSFTDFITGEDVNLYRCRLGNYWHATSPWAFFRVKVD